MDKHLDIQGIVKALIERIRADADLDVYKVLEGYGIKEKEKLVAVTCTLLLILSKSLKDRSFEPIDVRDNIHYITKELIPLLDKIIIKYLPEFNAVRECLFDLSERLQRHITNTSIDVWSFDIDTQNTFEEVEEDLSSYEETLDDSDEGSLISLQSSVDNIYTEDSDSSLIAKLESSFESSLESSLESNLSSQTTSLESSIDSLILMLKKYAYVYIKTLVDAFNAQEGISDEVIDSVFV